MTNWMSPAGRRTRRPCWISKRLALVLLQTGAVTGGVALTNGAPLWAQQVFGPRVRISDCDAVGPTCDAPGQLLMLPFPPTAVSPRPSSESDYWRDPSARPVPPGQTADRPADAPRADRADADATDAAPAVPDPAADAAAAAADGFADLDAADFSLDSSLASAGVQRGSFSSAPTMTGDLFGAGMSFLSVPQVERFSQVLPGFIINGAGPGSADAVLGFGLGGGPPADIFTSGPGIDSDGDGNIDQFSILEPIPPSNAPTSPGPGFVFSGGTAVFLSTPSPSPEPFEDGDEWRIDYSYIQRLVPDGERILLAGPDVATRRVKLSENFSPEVRDRVYMNYSYFNNAFGGLGDVNRWVLGWERILVDDLVSIELRQPMATTLGSRQDIDSPGERSYELGNLTAIGKVVMYRDQRWLWSSGLGVTAPLADDARLLRGDETLLKISNHAVHLLPFSAVLMRLNQNTMVQAFAQLDVDVNGNPVYGDLSGDTLPRLGRLRDATLLHLDTSIHRTLLRRSSRHLVREVIGNAELHYTGSLENANAVSGNGLTVTDLSRRFDVVNATFSSHWMLGERTVVTPGIAVPLSGGLNRQFNFEAILQLNYLR